MKLSKGTIHLDRIRLHGYIGVLPQEQIVGNEYEVSLRMDYPLGQSLLTDNVDDTANYADLLAIVMQHMQQRCSLLEYAAGRMAHDIFMCYPQAIQLTIDLCKIDPPLEAHTKGAGVSLTFTNET